jgi:hypothetical protein
VLNALVIRRAAPAWPAILLVSPFEGLDIAWASTGPRTSGVRDEPSAAIRVTLVILT